MVSELTEQVAEQLFKKHDRLGLNPWQGEESHISDYRRECWRSDARELIALITEACIDAIRTDFPDQHEMYCQGIYDSTQLIRALGEVEE